MEWLKRTALPAVVTSRPIGHGRRRNCERAVAKKRRFLEFPVEGKIDLMILISQTFLVTSIPFDREGGSDAIDKGIDMIVC